MGGTAPTQEKGVLLKAFLMSDHKNHAAPLCASVALPKPHSTTSAQQRPTLPMEYDAHLVTTRRELTIHSITQPGLSVKPKYHV